MSHDQSYPFPQVFLVDGAGSPQNSAQPPTLIPCWSFPPAQERMRSRGKSQGYMGVSPCLSLVVLLLFLLVFAALGFEAYQVYNMQTELRQMKEAQSVTEFNTAQKQIGFYEPQMQGQDSEDRPAAHVIGRIETKDFRKTLRWEPKSGQAFVSGGVTYRFEDGGLQVNESGLYHIYSRVELIFKNCITPPSFVHSVFVRRVGHLPPLTLMEAHRAEVPSSCSQHHAWTAESFLSSAMTLQKYDRVFVNVSEPRLLSHAQHGNFFGLYKIQ